MINLPTYLDAVWANSKRAHGAQRPPVAPLHEAHARLREVEDNPQGLYGWVDLIIAGIEGGLRSGATPFALAQALVNRQQQEGARKIPPPLPHLPENAQ